MKKIKCCVCGVRIKNPLDNHNPYPIRPYSSFGDTENRCCGMCNTKYVLPIRLINMQAERSGKFTEEEMQEHIRILHMRSPAELDYMLAKYKEKK